MRLALFDLDHTLLAGDSDHLWGDYMIERGLVERENHKRQNDAFYEDEGIERLESVLRPGGVLALWSAAREPALLQRMHARLKNVAEIVVPVDLDDGKSNLDYVYRGRRPPNPAEPKGPLN